ncbi:MAG: ethylbenzene dehydrogenase-related protein [Bryobacteraceae bacterium]
MRIALCLICVLLAAGCSKGPGIVHEVVAVHAEKLPESPDDPIWDRAPEHVAKMVPQDLVEPRLMTPSTGEVRVRSVTNGETIAFRLTWRDADKSDRPGPSKMVDACAIQTPEAGGPDLPDPQMGEPEKPVQLTYWRADWQALVDGRGDTIHDLYPNASVDHYPYEAKSLERGSADQQEMARRYAPAHVLGNLRAGPRTSAVESLVAAGPGTLGPGPDTRSAGRGVHGPEGWSVVLSRTMPNGLAPNQRTHIALAVWEGSRRETGARKMRSGWIPLLWRGENQ